MYVTACGIRNQEYMLEAFEKGEKNAIPFTLLFYSFTCGDKFNSSHLEIIVQYEKLIFNS